MRFRIDAQTFFTDRAAPPHLEASAMADASGHELTRRPPSPLARRRGQSVWSLPAHAYINGRSGVAEGKSAA